MCKSRFSDEQIIAMIREHAARGEDCRQLPEFERTEIANLALVSIGSNACISQGAYLCTGSHDWSSPTFDLIVKPITIRDGAWIAAKSTVGRGVTVGEGAVLGLGSTTSKDLEPWCIYSGSPAEFVRKRVLKTKEPV